MGFIVSDDGTTPNFAARSGGSWNGNEMGDFIGNIYIATDQVIILEKDPPDIYP